MTKRGTEAVIPKIRERAKVSLNKRSEVVSPLAVTVETITRRDMICKGKKTARNDERTIHGTESQTTGLLARFVVNQSGESQEHTKEEGKVGLLLPAFDVGGGYGRVWR